MSKQTLIDELTEELNQAKSTYQECNSNLSKRVFETKIRAYSHALDLANYHIHNEKEIIDINYIEKQIMNVVNDFVAFVKPSREVNAFVFDMLKQKIILALQEYNLNSSKTNNEKNMLDKEQIKSIALRNGFQLNPQTNGEMDLNEYVYTAFNEVAKHCWSAWQSGVMPHKIHPTKASLNNGWISIDNPPEKDGEYLVYGFDDFENCHKQKLEYFIAKDKSFITDLSFVITHWQLLPNPPKEKT